jgi:hypothetical protein
MVKLDFMQSISELSDKDILKIPTIIKNKILMAPGIWNGVEYTGDEIKRAYNNTDWKDKDIISIILDHADKPLKVSDWVGWVKNPRLEGDNLIGDLELYDEPVLVKLVQAKAKFGISPRVKGLEHDGQFRNFTFENFSVVTNPAVKKAYINLSQDLRLMKGGNKMVGKELEAEETIENEDADFIEDLDDEELAKKDKKMAKKKKYPEPAAEEQMSDDEFLQISTMSDWTDFVKKQKAKNPNISFQEIAKAYKGKTAKDKEMEELSDSDLVAKLEQITSILRKRKAYPPVDEEAPAKKDDEEMKKKNMSFEIKVKEMSQQIEELNSKLKEPNAKSVISQELKDNTRMMATPSTTGVEAFADFLQKEFLQ